MILKLNRQGAPALYQVAQEVPQGTDRKQLIADMFETMTAYGGIGLAANQVDVLERIIVFKIGGFKRAIINPVIVDCKGGGTSREGCLSFPGQTATKARARQITVRGFNENWEPVKFNLKQLRAYCVQHEIDHLNGVTIGS
jgi:peptide deformylase